METTHGRNLLKVAEAAKSLNIDKSTVLRWIEKGYLKSVHFPSGTHRIPGSEIDRLLKTTVKPEVKTRILVIDDEDYMLEFIKETFQQLGFPAEITALRDGLSAMLLLGTYRPDIVIMDYKLDDVNGLSLAKRIRENKELSQIPILMISGVIDDLPHEDTCVSAFLRKPFSPETLIKTVDDCLIA